jgi:GT2 family glycosyltransferase
MFNLVGWRHLRRARAAAALRDWQSAARFYRAYLRHQPRKGSAWIQLGHALKEGGDLDASLVAYRRATEVVPYLPEGWLQLGHALRLDGNRTGAVKAFQRSVELDPSFAGSLEELISLGERERLSEDAQSLAEGGVGSESIYAVSRYSVYRSNLATLPPPAVEQERYSRITVLIDARSASPAAIRITLLSLITQTVQHWNAIVICESLLADHPVSSFGYIDQRIRFVEADDRVSLTDGDWVLCLSAGTECDRLAMDWFAFAAHRTGADLIYCDDDVANYNWKQGRSYDRPLFQPMFDAVWFSDPSVTPAAVLQRQERVATAMRWDQTIDRKEALLAAGKTGVVAHVPQLLVSRGGISACTEHAPHRSRNAARQDVIQIIIQTRDAAGLLGACVESLRSNAKRPDLLDIVIVDNRSALPETSSLLERWKTRGVARIVAHDEPFNWSRANNMAAARSEAPIILFLNNDTEAMTIGWDDLLRERLTDPQIGIVGAQLLYPDGSIQHAGVVLGMERGGPIHEGVGRNPSAGPFDRWRRSRLTAAVTGAWLGMRREVFEAVGGFDESLAIAFNDIDLCLRVRQAQFVIVQEARIVGLHRESMTRGLHLTQDALAWDLSEFQTLHDRWGPSLRQDPAYNPHWTRLGRPFDGLRFPSLEEIVAWLDRSATVNPWILQSADP